MRRILNEKENDYVTNKRMLFHFTVCFPHRIKPGCLIRLLRIHFLKLLLDPRPEDGESYKFMSVRPSVRPYVSNAFFSELVHLIFLIFCMKLEIHKCEKVTEPDFSEKFSFAQIWAKRAQKWTFFTFSQNSFISFSDMVHEVRGL